MVNMGMSEQHTVQVSLDQRENPVNITAINQPSMILVADQIAA